MSALDKRQQQVPEFYDKHTLPFAVEALSADLLVLLVQNYVFLPVRLGVQVKVVVGDSEFANGLSGLGGGSTSKTSSRCRKRANKADQKYDWSLDNIEKIYVKAANDAIIPVVSRTTLVFNSSLFMDGVWVPQDLEEIGLLETLEDEVVCVLDVCDVLKFLRDLYPDTDSDIGMTRMLGRLEPMCQGEQVLDRTTSLEDQTEREAIYKNHLETQAALVAATASPAAAAAPGSVACFDVAAGNLDVPA
jgi:hypothetical protein